MIYIYIYIYIYTRSNFGSRNFQSQEIHGLWVVATPALGCSNTCFGLYRHAVPILQKTESVQNFLGAMFGLHSGSQPANQVQHTPTTRTRHGTRCKRKIIRLPLGLAGTCLDEYLYTPTSFWLATHMPECHKSIDTHLRASSTRQQAPALINTHLQAASTRPQAPT